jgi:hypothetical protein
MSEQFPSAPPPENLPLSHEEQEESAYEKRRMAEDAGRALAEAAERAAQRLKEHPGKVALIRRRLQQGLVGTALALGLAGAFPSNAEAGEHGPRRQDQHEQDRRPGGLRRFIGGVLRDSSILVISGGSESMRSMERGQEWQVQAHNRRAEAAEDAIVAMQAQQQKVEAQLWDCNQRINQVAERMSAARTEADRTRNIELMDRLLAEKGELEDASERLAADVREAQATARSERGLAAGTVDRLERTQDMARHQDLRRAQRDTGVTLH